MMDKSRELLETAMEERFEKLEQLPLDEQEVAIEQLQKLYSMKVKEDEIQEQILEKETELLERRKDRRVKIVLDSVSLAIPLIVYTGLYFAGLHFEKTGNICSFTVKNHFGRNKLK